MDSDLYLSDDGLEDVNEEELQALEEQAILTATQVRRGAQAVGQQHYNHNNNHQNQHITGTEYITLPTLRSSAARRENGPARPPSQTSDYGDFNETIELWDTAGPTAPLTAPNVNVAEYGNSAAGVQDGQNAGTSDYGGDVYDMMDDAVDEDVLMGNARSNVVFREASGLGQLDTEKEEMRRALEELSRERESLLQELRAAKDAAMAKSGEIAIIRSNIDRQTKEHARALQSLTNVHTEERENYKQELNAVRAEIERLKTDNAFLKNDMDIMVKKNKTVDRTRQAHDRGMRQGSLTVDLLKPHESPQTPRKNKGFDYRDGFNDMEMLSPSKTNRAASRTPTSRPGSKRKRAIHDSPLFELPLSQNRAPAVETPPAQAIDYGVLERLYHDEENLEFYEYFIARKSQSQGLSTLEALSTFHLPSDPETSLSALFMEAFSSVKSELGDGDLIAIIGRTILSVWEQCMGANYFAPTSLLIELLNSCVSWGAPATVLQFHDFALGLIQKTVDVVALPRLQKQQTLAGSEKIDVEGALRLMYAIGNMMHGNDENKLRYWKKIRMDFPLILIDQSQEIQHIRIMLQILTLSIWPNSFGPSPGVESKKVESVILDRLGKLLNEDPRRQGDGSACEYRDLILMRLDIVRFLGTLVQNPYGLEAVAENPYVICRLVRRISDEVDEMYRFRSGVSLSVSFLNSAINLLFAILTLHPVELAEKLSKIPGTAHKYMSSMTRIGFSDGHVQEAGLDPEVVNRAYDLVEMAVTPEEADALITIFGRRE